MRPRQGLSAALAAALMGLPAGCHAEEPAPPPETEAPQLGLMGTIPIYWGEAEGFGGTLSGDGAAHWARTRIEANYRLEPLDMLDAASLAGLDYLLLAQPRPLTAAENVALDAWVRGGGKLLLFADPMLTGESRFAIGDRRRPQDVILLSPILRHWGIELGVDEGDEPGFKVVNTNGASIPVNLPGSITVTDEADCAAIVSDVLARCHIGSGQVVVLADAAVLDLYEPHAGAGPALDWLLKESFARNGDGAGNSFAHSATSQKSTS